MWCYTLSFDQYLTAIRRVSSKNGLNELGSTRSRKCCDAYRRSPSAFERKITERTFASKHGYLELQPSDLSLARWKDLFQFPASHMANHFISRDLPPFTGAND